MSKLLINQPPLQVLPDLAVKIGLNEAIILQQLHYWVERSVNIIEDKKWVYNDYAAWREQFPFWSEKTIQRSFLALEKLGIVTSKQFEKYTSNYTKRNRRKWYTIDYARFAEFEKEEPLETKPASEQDNMGHTKDPEEDKVSRSGEEDKVSRSTYTENTITENTSDWTESDWPLIKVLGDEGYDPDSASAVNLGRIAKAENSNPDQLREALLEMDKQESYIKNQFGWIRAKLRELKVRDELYFQRVPQKVKKTYQMYSAK